jgi:hypothetical protein
MRRQADLTSGKAAYGDWGAESRPPNLSGNLRSVITFHYYYYYLFNNPSSQPASNRPTWTPLRLIWDNPSRFRQVLLFPRRSFFAVTCENGLAIDGQLILIKTIFLIVKILRLITEKSGKQEALDTVVRTRTSRNRIGAGDTRNTSVKLPVVLWLEGSGAAIKRVITPDQVQNQDWVLLSSVDTRSLIRMTAAPEL